MGYTVRSMRNQAQQMREQIGDLKACAARFKTKARNLAAFRDDTGIFWIGEPSETTEQAQVVAYLIAGGIEATAKAFDGDMIGVHIDPSRMDAADSAEEEYHGTI